MHPTYVQPWWAETPTATSEPPTSLTSKPDWMLALAVDLAQFDAHLQRSLTHLTLRLAQVPMPRYALQPVYVADPPELAAEAGVTWRRGDGLAYM